MTTINVVLGLLTITLAFSVGTPAQAQSFLTNGLVAYYPFTGNANDMSGNNDHGTNIGAVSVQDRFGNANGAYYFNVTNLSAIVASGKYLPIGASARTITFWAKPDRRLDSIFYRGDMLGYGTINGNAGSVICPFVWQPAPVVTLPLGSDLFQWNTSVSGWNFTTWHHFVWVITDGAHAALVLDGQQQVLQAYPPPLSSLNTSEGPLYIGYFTGNYFNGSIDDVRIYNRALSATEVQQLYQYESSLQPCIPHAATATAQLANGFVVGATITDSGCGYTNTPLVVIEGGGGTGATATAVVNFGVVTAIRITDAGIGYSNAPTVLIASPPFVPWLEIGVSTVKVTQHVVLGNNYVLESSGDLQTWTQVGTQFTAQDEVLTQVFDVAETGRYFRIRQVP